MKLGDNRARAERIAIERIHPEIEGGRFAAKRAIGETFVVEADVFADGHDEVRAVLLYRPERRDPAPENSRAGSFAWAEIPMEPIGNDRYRASFRPDALGRHWYTVAGWIDPFATWRKGIVKKIEAKQDVDVDLRIGAALVEEAAARATGEDREFLASCARKLRGDGGDGADGAARGRIAASAELMDRMARWPDRSGEARRDPPLPLVVDRERARHGAWYEMFPRSVWGAQGEHATFADCEKRLPYIASLGFDVLYLPPIHPIGVAHRKGRNNTPSAGPDDPGSPWAIGSAEGGHDAVHPRLGSLADLRRLIARAREHGIEIALDLALQTSPDHPWTREHPEWFRRRPDGTIQYAENPPKKYEDIYPIDFESADRDALWREARRIVRFWCDQGIRIFRVDNPHTKPFAFWEWLIESIREEHPDVLFLAEAFTRPKIVYRLAKLGFNQSYNYFPWRNSKWELTDYFTELTRGEAREYFRPNLWTNTPDILTEYLQVGGLPAFRVRLVLAGLLGASYGIYGPVFELGENLPSKPGSEEYRDSEKYEIRHWDVDRADSLAPLIREVNRIRRENPALQRDAGLQFHPIDNDRMLAFTKESEDRANVVLAVVNLDPRNAQSGWLHFPLEPLRLDPRRPFAVEDLLEGTRTLWQGKRNLVRLDPALGPAMIARIHPHMRTEQDFEYFLGS
ncbi:MAG: alpha-1,4-glucan--maltose-1-phosphate maltosyltransferase [Candidatus Eisenbacteria bacterium]|nr:alpha-1,4-glucan--maltose-1-phosphate maltosyltransferase [Candidatus Eisenbacteria bacterium]